MHTKRLLIKWVGDMHKLYVYFANFYLNLCDFIIVYADAIILMLIAFMLVIWIIPEEIKQTVIIENNGMDESDYNFLSTQDSIPSRFDLAIALASMGKTEEALIILNKLSQSKNLETKNRADSMIQSLTSVAVKS